MATVTIRNLPLEVYNAIKARALKAGRSAEAEMRLILKDAVMPEDRINVAAVFAEFRRRTGGVDLGDLRDKKDREQVDFSEWCK